MSNQKRRPQQQQQYYAQNYTPDMTYTQYAGAAPPPPWQNPQQQLYYPTPQQYASTDAYGYAHTAPQQPYPQLQAYPATNYLTPEYAASSPAHSPQPHYASGRARTNNFTYPNQGASPNPNANFEVQMGHLRLGQRSPLPTASRNTSSAEAKSDLSLRYPPLPTIPSRPSTPSELQSSPSSVQEYVSSLRSIISTYSSRDDLLRLRTEAVGFQPRAAYLAWQSPSPIPTSSDAPANPILGIRLLQRLDKLQRENDELALLLSSQAGKRKEEEGVEELRREVEESHALIAAMDKALQEAEEKVERGERALQAACQENSTAITGVKAKPKEEEGEGEGKKPALNKGARGRPNKSNSQHKEAAASAAAGKTGSKAHADKPSRSR